MVNDVMARSVEGWLGGADVHAPVHLHGVDHHDLGVGDGVGGGHRHLGLS